MAPRRNVLHSADVFPNSESLSRNLLHIEQSVLERYVTGALIDEDELAPAEEHLLVCHQCQDRLASFDAKQPSEFARHAKARRMPRAGFHFIAALQ